MPPENETTAAGWLSDGLFKTEHVNPRVPATAGDFVSAESVILAAKKGGSGDADGLADLGSYIPLGLVESVTVTQNKNIQQIFEIGSRLPYFIPGRTIIQGGISRILIDGNSLMKVVYPGLGAEDGQLPGGVFIADDNDTDVENAFYINLADDFFHQSLDLAFILADKDGNATGGFIMQNCLITSHQLSIGAQQTVILENMGLRCEKIHPLGNTSTGTD